MIEEPRSKLRGMRSLFGSTSGYGNSSALLN